MVCFLCGEGPKNFCISRELWRLEISAVEEQRPWNRGSTGGGTKRFFISRELWRLEIRAVEEQRPFWELPWRPRAGLRALSRRQRDPVFHG